MTDKTEAERLAEALQACVQTYPQMSEDEPGGYCTEADQLMDEAAAELLRLSAEVEALRDSNAAKADRIDRLGEMVEALRADAGRLDFIEKHARCDPKMDGQHVWWPTNFNRALKGPTLRAAIDAAKDKP